MLVKVPIKCKHCPETISHHPWDTNKEGPAPEALYGHCHFHFSWINTEDHKSITYCLVEEGCIKHE